MLSKIYADFANYVNLVKIVRVLNQKKFNEFEFCIKLVY